MSKAPKQLTWVGAGKAPRARLIPDEKWERYREELIALRQSMTLESILELIEAKSDKYGFTPT